MFKGSFADKHRLNLWFLFPWLNGLYVIDEKKKKKIAKDKRL